MKKIILTFLIFLSVSTIFCNRDPDDNGIIAYPVPFNPDSQLLKISYPNGVTPPQASFDKVTIDISDINEDEVFHDVYGSTTLAFTSPIIWNGRNNSGNIVGAGEYIIEIVTGNTQTGYYLSSNIIILIQR